MAFKNFKFYLFLLLVPSLLYSQECYKMTNAQKCWVEDADMYEKNGWIVVQLKGEPEAIGFQHGFLLADKIIDLREAMIMYIENSTGKKWEFYRNESMRLLWPGVPAEYQSELWGIVEGVNNKLGDDTIDLPDIVAMNSNLEMAGYYLPWLQSRTNPEITPKSSIDRCSAIAATGSWTTDGKIVMAHSCWTDYVTGQYWNIIFYINPDKGHTIVMDGMPGFIHSGDDFFMNNAGLIVTETTITQFFGFDTSGTPEFARARQAIQYSSTIDEWVATMVEKNNGGYANDWLIGDNKTGEIARLELGLKNHPLERTNDGYFAGANYPSDPKLIAEETTFDSTLMNTSPNARKVRWKELMSEYRGKIDVNVVMKFMGDHYNTWEKTDRPCALTLCGHYEFDESGVACWGTPPFFPGGAVQAKAINSSLASELSLWAIMGHPCGEPFIAKKFLEQHPEYKYQEKYLHDLPAQKWTLFRYMDY